MRSQRANPSSGIDLNAYKQKKAEQLAHAKALRDQRAQQQRQHQHQQNNVNEPETHSSAFRSSTPPLPVLHEVTTPTYSENAYHPNNVGPSPTGSNGYPSHAHAPVYTSGPSGIATNHNWAAVQPPPSMFRADSAREFSGSGQKLLLGEQDIAGAVTSGILTMDQADKLWRFLVHQHSTGGSHSEPCTPHEGFNATAPQHPQKAHLHAPPEQQRQHSAPGRVATDDGYGEFDNVVATRKQAKPARQKKPEWNMDTEIVHHDDPPEDDYVQQRAPPPAQRKPKPTARVDHRPGFNLDTGEGDGGFGEPPPLPGRRQPAQRAAKPKPTQRQQAPPPGGSYAQQYQQQQQGYGYADNGMDDQGSNPNSARGGNKRVDPLATLKARRTSRGASAGAQQQAPPAQHQYFHQQQQQATHDDRTVEYELEQRENQERRAQVEVDAYASEDVAMGRCPTCNRTFREDRLAKHAAACAKSSKKRPEFNMKKHRQEGEAAQQERAAKRQAGPRGRTTGANKYSEDTALKKMPKWKAQSLALQSAMKAARGAPADPAPGFGGGGFGGGGGGGYAQPPDTRVECPHCTRRFAEEVAERHIPKCKNMIHKPKPLMRKR
eukprot:TRINITY_DN51412_c0_g1_i1.p1 TRINITY_DN51412_c0_g1~~TRINITY_DN51412_c0_g1_i1.p1  ORF type:complete len:605 (+),score=107.22 TRINITY_DN51412_c0_g1_i1:59-1873(+)